MQCVKKSQSTIQVRVIPNNCNEIWDKMKLINCASNYASKEAFKRHIFTEGFFNTVIYKDIRGKYVLSSIEAVAIVRNVYCLYKKDARKLIRFNMVRSIPLYKHVYYKKDVIIYGIKCSMAYRDGIILPRHPRQAILSYKNHKFIINQSVDVACDIQLDNISGYLGCDLGIKNILTDSDGFKYSGNKLLEVRERNLFLRAQLLGVGTRSAKRKIRDRNQQESNYARDIYHIISKNTVLKAMNTKRGIAVEDLNGIQERCKYMVGKAYRRNITSWGYCKLRSYIEYKGRLNGVCVTTVNPMNTSRICPSCGFSSKNNRKTRDSFICTNCGYENDADIVAAVNISRRAAGNQPIAPSNEVVQAINNSSCLGLTRVSRIVEDYKKCKVCGIVFARGNESSNIWDKRCYCSHECLAVALTKDKNIIKCTVCGEIINKKQNDVISKYSKRKYCSRVCFNEDQRGKHRKPYVKLSDRQISDYAYCKNCGCIIMRSYSGFKDGQFIRKYCSSKCYRESVHKSHLERIKN